MKQKDYKEIAEIIKNRGIPTNEVARTLVNISHKLADYFEKEDRENLGNGVLLPTTPQFNREQFLERCGVKQ